MQTIARITTGANEVDVNVLPAAICAFEEEHDQTIAEAIESDRLKWFPWIVWWTLQKRHGETREFMDWFSSVDDLEDITPPTRTAADSAVEADPTGAAPDPGSAE